MIKFIYGMFIGIIEKVTMKNMRQPANEIINLIAIYKKQPKESIAEEIDARLWCLFKNQVFRPKETGIFWFSTSVYGDYQRLTNFPRYTKDYDIEYIKNAVMIYER